MEPAGLTLPVVLGHENAGWVHAVGDDVTAAEVGDAVLVYPAYSCGLCVPCRRGFDIDCERHQFTGLTRDGGFSEYVLVDERSLIRLPDGVDLAEVAPHADAGITAYHAVKKLLPRLAPGSTTAVIGVGGVGHIGLQLVRVLGGGTVIGIDTDERRRRLARELGADEVLGEEADVADAVREATNGVGRRRRARLRRDRCDPRVGDADARASRPLLHRRLRGHRLASVRRLRGGGDGRRREPRRQLDRSVGAPRAPCPRPDHASDRDASARGGERRARQAPGRRGHRAGRLVP